MKYLNRELESKIEQYLKLFPVVGLTGPRQSGKSTLLQNLLKKKYKYVSFDDPAIVSFFLEDPEQFLSVYESNTIFDEVQRVPELFRYIKIKVDSNRTKYGQYILTGSAQFAFIKGITETLAGRIGLLSLLPLDSGEIPKAQKKNSMWMGGYPELVNRRYNGVFDWYKSYVDTYLTRDVRTLLAVGDLREFLTFIRILAGRSSQVLNFSDISKDIGLSVPTVKKWISILEASFIVFLVPPYYKNFGKRLIKAPKLYFYDTGLISYLTGLRSREQFETGPLYGAIYENYIVAELKKKLLHTASDSELYYFRESNGNEIDIICDSLTGRQNIEIKGSFTLKTEMVSVLKKYSEPKVSSFLVFRGKSKPLGESLSAVNDFSFLENFPRVNHPE